MKKILLVFPTSWDRKQLAQCRACWQSSYEPLWTEPADEDCPWDFDVLAFIDETARRCRGAIHGVISSSDYPGSTVAHAIAAAAGLPGCGAAIMLRAAHKFYSRIEQAAAAPEATPRFDLIDPRLPPPRRLSIGFPCFVKPVKGSFSVLARPIDGPEQLESFLGQPAVAEYVQTYMAIFNRLVRRFTGFRYDGGNFLAEELLPGVQVTVEGYACKGRVEILGIVDSIIDPATGSFVRFDYPSRLEPAVCRRMEQLAQRVIGRLGLDYTLFNIELAYDSSDGGIRIIEVNPRMCGQFADLYQKVDGRNSYELALELATGHCPAPARRQGEYAAASSFPLRVFEPVRVRRAPSGAEIGRAEGLYPGTLVWNECRTGQELCDFAGFEDGRSHRYSVINVGGSDRGEVLGRAEEIRASLCYQFEPLAVPFAPVSPVQSFVEPAVLPPAAPLTGPTVLPPTAG